MSIDNDEEVYIDEIKTDVKNLSIKNVLNKIEIKPLSIMKSKLYDLSNNKINDNKLQIGNTKVRRNKRRLKRGNYIIKSIPLKKKSNKIFI